MMLPLSPAHIDNEILRLCALLESRTDELAGRARAQAETEANHKGMWASAFLKAEGTDARRKATADEACHKLYTDRLIADAMYSSTKESCASLRAQISALQTLAANLRVQV